MPEGSRRRYLVLGVVLLVVVVAAIGLQRLLFPPVPEELEVISVKGDVTLLTPGGPEAKLATGAKVKLGQTVRTGGEGEAVIRGENQGAATVIVSDHSRVAVEEVREGVARIRLDEGRVTADQPDGSSGGVTITGGKDGASITTRGGRIAAALDPGGDLTMATLRGSATVRDGNITQDLPAGSQAIASGGRIEVGKIPSNILLHVSWPQLGKTRDPEAKVRVQVPHGTLLRVNDRLVSTGTNGAAVATVKLDEGANQIKIDAA